MRFLSKRNTMTDMMTDTKPYTVPEPMDFGNFFVLSMLSNCFEKDEERATAVLNEGKAYLNRLEPEKLKNFYAIAEKCTENLNRWHWNLRMLLKDYEEIENEEKRKKMIEQTKGKVFAEMQKIFNSAVDDVGLTSESL